MDEHPQLDLHEELQSPETPEVEETSAEYLGRWNRLVSTTNWEKGRIIAEWREALIAAEAPAASYSDEAWSRRVGNVSPQHVGRLRRVHERFGSVCEQYAGLYWSHFQAALDWPDAEMWLEGAVQNGWSVARMRLQRWEALGAPADKKPRPEDVVTGELDEDYLPDGEEPFPGEISESLGVVRDAQGVVTGGSPVVDDTAQRPSLPAAQRPSLPAAQRPSLPAAQRPSLPAALPGELPIDQPQVEPFRPFENLPTLPSDLNEAFEAFKLAILHHRVAGWKQTSLDDVLSVLDALKQLALAPPEN